MGAMVVVSLLDEIAQTLEQQSDPLRLKKLVFCACNNRWENNSAVLDRIPLADLLREIYQKNPTIEQLSTSLDRIVQSLNRKNEYQAIAKNAIDKLSELYQPPPEITQFFSPPEEVTQFSPHSPKPPSPFTPIIQTLDNNPYSLRLRKLIYCAWANQWENNSSVLLDLDLEDVLGDIQKSYPHLEALTAAFNSIVAGLNRKDQYQAIADFLITQLAPLYPPVEVTNWVQSHLPTPETPTIALNNSISSDIPTAALKPNPPTAPLTLNSDGNLPSTTNFTPQSPQLTPPPPDTAKTPTYQPFEVRLEVMKYANPLRAKILAFSTLHHQFEAEGQDWSNLRTRTFDELLLELYQTYTRLTELEGQLYETAKNLEASDESLQAAEAIVKAMKSYYKNE